MIQPPSQRDQIAREDGRVTDVYQRWFSELAKSISGNVGPIVPPVTPAPMPVDHGTIQGLGSVQVFGVLPNVVQITLDGDDVAPGENYYYGTASGFDPENPRQARGWHPLPTLPEPFGGAVPYYVADDTTFTVREFDQALFTIPIDLGAGAILDLSGMLVEVS